MSYQYRRMLNISVCTVLINKMIDMSNAILQLMTHKGWLHLRRFQNCNKINVKMGIFILNVEMWLVILFSTLFVISTYRNAPKLLYIWSIANWVKKKVKYSISPWKIFLKYKILTVWYIEIQIWIKSWIQKTLDYNLQHHYVLK